MFTSTDLPTCQAIAIHCQFQVTRSIGCNMYPKNRRSIVREISRLSSTKTALVIHLLLIPSLVVLLDSRLAHTTTRVD